jgi:hypothetical protein
LASKPEAGAETDLCYSVQQQALLSKESPVGESATKKAGDAIDISGLSSI